jgi:hypothetical protein
MGALLYGTLWWEKAGRARNPLKKMVDAQGIEPWTSPV